MECRLTSILFAKSIRYSLQSMKDRTRLPGKDLPLEETIEKTISLLEDMDLPTKEVSWLNPAPDCWSVHIEATSCSHLYTNGKGTSELACLASGLGEFMERLSTNLFFSDYYLGAFEEKSPFCFSPDEAWFAQDDNEKIPTNNNQGIQLLTPQLRRFYDPEGELGFDQLCDNNIDLKEKKIAALPFFKLSDQTKTYFPVSLLNNLYVSNGMAAGNSRAECCSQALSEIIERYVKQIVIKKGISLPDVPAAHLKKFPRVTAILDTLTQDQLSVRVKDASFGGQYPVICVLVADFVSGGVFAAFGASLRFETAVLRTLTELLQGRSLDKFKGFEPPCHDLDQVADAFNLESHFIDSDGLLSWNMFRDKADFPFSPWDFTGPTEKEFSLLQKIITTMGFGIYRAEYLHCGMYSCRILVPGMSEIYPIEDLIWNNKGTGSQLRSQLLHLPDMGNSKLHQLLDFLEILGLNDQQLISEVIGVIFDEASNWATLRIGELKAMILLALGKKVEALLWCDWCLVYGSLPEKRKRHYRLLQSLLNFQQSGKRIDDFKKGLNLFYQPTEIKEAKSVLAGKTTFFGLTFAGDWTEISAEHNNLLKIYHRINSRKR